MEPWFRRRIYGGWTPANTKGWAVVLGYVALLNVYPLTHLGRGRFSIGIFWVITVVLTLALFAICFLKSE
jgi:hypothetical protein